MQKVGSGLPPGYKGELRKRGDGRSEPSRWRFARLWLSLAALAVIVMVLGTCDFLNPLTNESPVAVVTVSSSVPVGVETVFDGTLSTDETISTLQYRWDFLDVPTASTLDSSDIRNRTSAIARATPDVAGQYWIQLTVTDEEGKTGVASKTIDAVLGIPAAPTSLSIDEATATSITLGWSVVPTATGYELYTDTSSTGSFTTKLYDGALLTYTHTGLANASTHWYKLLAKNTVGSGPLCAALRGDTLGVVPATPTGLAAASPTTSSLAISWSASSGATSYQVYRDTSSTGGFATAAYDGSDTSFADSGLNSATTYYYKVKATNDWGSSALSSAASGTTAAVVPAPSTPTGLAVGTATSSSLPLSWNAATNATGYELYVDSSSTGAFSEKVYDGASTSFAHSGLAAELDYWYKVLAKNATGSSALSAAVKGTTLAEGTAPATPGGLGVGSATTSSLSVSWLASEGATSYKLYRDTTAGGAFTSSVYTGTALAYVDTALTASTTYWYKVQALNAYGSSALSTAVSGLTATPDSTAPVVASFLINGGAATTSSVTVTLNSSVSDAGSGMHQMRFSNDGGTTWSTWETYAATKSWALTSGDGDKTVSAQFSDQSGNVAAASDGIILDSTGPSIASFYVAGGAAWTSSTAVVLSMSVSGATLMQFSNDGTTWSAYEAYANTKNWSLAPTQGTQTVRARFSDGTNVSEVADSIGLDSILPTGSVTINGGAAYINTTGVYVNSSASDSGSGVYLMRFSVNAGSTWTTVSYTTAATSLTLPAGDGVKTVYAQFGDRAGNWSGSYLDTILLDTVLPIASISINAGAAYTASVTSTLYLSATDTGSGVQYMRFLNSGGSWTALEAYSTSKVWALLSVDGVKTVYVQLVDRAGNYSNYAYDQITLDTVAPTRTSLSINSGNPAYTRYTSATLYFSCSDATSGLSQIRFMNSGGAWSAWMAYPTSGAASWTLLTGDGYKSVYMEVKDAAGNVNTASFYDSIYLDTVAPTVSSFMINSNVAAVDPGSATATSFNVALSMSVSDTGSGLQDMYFYGAGATSAYVPYATTYTYPIYNHYGTRYVYAVFRDRAGNTSNASDSILVYARLLLNFYELYLTNDADDLAAGEIYYYLMVNGLTVISRSGSSTLSLNAPASITSLLPPASYNLLLNPATGSAFSVTARIMDDDAPLSDDMSDLVTKYWYYPWYDSLTSHGNYIYVSGSPAGNFYFYITANE